MNKSAFDSPRPGTAHLAERHRPRPCGNHCKTQAPPQLNLFKREKKSKVQPNPNKKIIPKRLLLKMNAGM
jgi:hypothetical protein